MNIVYLVKQKNEHCISSSHCSAHRDLQTEQKMEISNNIYLEKSENTCDLSICLIFLNLSLSSTIFGISL